MLLSESVCSKKIKVTHQFPSLRLKVKCSGVTLTSSWLIIYWMLTTPNCAAKPQERTEEEAHLLWNLHFPGCVMKPSRPNSHSPETGPGRGLTHTGKGLCSNPPFAPKSASAHLPSYPVPSSPWTAEWN